MFTDLLMIPNDTMTSFFWLSFSFIHLQIAICFVYLSLYNWYPITLFLIIMYMLLAKGFE